jgi:hypothetical protein
VTKCMRCGHDAHKHGRRGGWCGAVDYTSRVTVDDDDNAVTTISELTPCDCRYLVASSS